MSARLRCGVIGAGVMGAAAAWALAKAGAAPVVFDRFGPLHAHGGSHGATRLFRLAYFEHPDYAPLLQQALVDWKALNDVAVEKIFHQTGVLYLGPEDGPLIAGVKQSAALHGLPLVPLSEQRITRQHGWLRAPCGDAALFDPLAGYVEAERAVATFTAIATAAGAEFHWRSAVKALEADEKGFKVITRDAAFQVDRLVLAPGAFANELFEMFDLSAPCPITPIEKVLCWQAPGNAALHRDNGVTPFVIETMAQEIYYGFPAIDGDGVKVGRHHGGAALPSPAVRQYANREEAEAIVTMLASYAKGSTLPTANGKRTSCLYAMSPDGAFVIDRAVEDPRIVYAIGFSGHGFKFAPAIGRALSALIMDRAPPQDIAFLSARRFEH